MNGPSSRVHNELQAGGGKISLGWNPLLPNSQRLVSANRDTTHHKSELLIIMVHPRQRKLATNQQLLAQMTLKTDL